MSVRVPQIRCASAKITDLCHPTTCAEDVCGCCSFCGRPISVSHGKMDGPYDNYFCLAHGHKNSVGQIVTTVKMLLRLQAQGIDIFRVSDEDLAQRILTMTKKR